MEWVFTAYGLIALAIGIRGGKKLDYFEMIVGPVLAVLNMIAMDFYL